MLYQLRLRNVRVLRPMVHLHRSSSIRCSQVRTKARRTTQIPGHEEKLPHSNQLSQDTNQSAYNQELEKNMNTNTTHDHEHDTWHEGTRTKDIYAVLADKGRTSHQATSNHLRWGVRRSKMGMAETRNYEYRITRIETPKGTKREDV